MSTRNGILAFLGGAMAGAIVALLYAPERGEVTRRRIGDAVDRGRDNLMDAMERGKEKIEDAIAMGKDKVEDVLHSGKMKAENAIRHGKEMINDEMAMMCEDHMKNKK